MFDGDTTISGSRKEMKRSCVRHKPRVVGTVMFFGLTNSPATFQSMMNNIFADLITEGRAIVYLDNILIYSEHLEEYCSTFKEVLRIL
jgi:hypothetical protein